VASMLVVPEAGSEAGGRRVGRAPPGTAVVFGANIAYQLRPTGGAAADEIGKPDQWTPQKVMLPAIWDLGTYQASSIYARMWNQCMVSS